MTLQKYRTNDAPNQQFQLSDGRTLGFQLLGDPHGRPLFLFHGTPGSRLCLSAEDPIACIPGLMLVVPERPGYGLSSPQPGRTITDWPADIKELATELDLPTFSVAGSSGGGPYALACAASLQQQIHQVLLLNTAGNLWHTDATKGMSFGNKLGMRTAKWAPWLLKMLIGLASRSFKKSPESNLDALTKELPPEDAVWMEDPEFRNAVKRDIQEAYSNGIIGHYSDAILAHKDWNIPFAEITAPVHVWHGEADNLSPIQNVRVLVDQLSDCTTHYLKDAGHFLIDRPDVIADIKTLLPSL